MKSGHLIKHTGKQTFTSKHAHLVNTSMHTNKCPVLSCQTAAVIRSRMPPGRGAASLTRISPPWHSTSWPASVDSQPSFALEPPMALLALGCSTLLAHWLLPFSYAFVPFLVTLPSELLGAHLTHNVPDSHSGLCCFSFLVTLQSQLEQCSPPSSRSRSFLIPLTLIHIYILEVLAHHIPLSLPWTTSWAWLGTPTEED